MKHKFVLFFLFFSLISTVNAQSDQDRAIQTFKIIAAKFSEFFKSPQKLIYKQSFSESPTGINVEVIEYHCSNISYDINITESLISPYVGYVDLELSSLSNCACGNVSYTVGAYKRITGWDNEKDALDNVNGKDCYKQQFDISGKLDEIQKDNVRVNYAYQNNKWIFKNVSSTPISNAFNIISAPGVKLQDSSSFKFNSPWVKLVNSD
jgi:hypothetical protein